MDALRLACRWIDDNTGTCPPDLFGFKCSRCDNCDNNSLECWIEYFEAKAKEAEGR